MAEELVVGSNATPASSGVKNYLYGTLFQAIETANGVTKFYLYGAGSGNVKVAVYSDNAGAIGSRLGYNDTGQAIVSGWNELSISSVNISSGTSYFLIGVSDVDNIIGRDTSGGTSKYRLSGGDGYSTWAWAEPIGGDAFNSSSALYAYYLLGETGSLLIPAAHYYMN
jgi:hypothetical protein